MPALSSASARWDAEATKVRYYASFEGTAEWIEVPPEDFDRLTRLFAQEAIDVICEAISTTLNDVRTTLAEFSAFREGLEKLSEMTRSRAEGVEN
jgi:hypothetical protein